MKQSKLESWLETGVNIVTGFMIAWAAWQWIVLPIWEYDVTPADNFNITMFFTVISIIRSYLWRRYFNDLFPHQTKLQSFLEQCANMGSGLIISVFLLTYVINPFYGFEASPIDNILITAIFPALSIIRGYFWRRFFNAGLHKKVHEFAGWLFNLKNKLNQITGW